MQIRVRVRRRRRGDAPRRPGRPHATAAVLLLLGAVGAGGCPGSGYAYLLSSPLAAPAHDGRVHVVTHLVQHGEGGPVRAWTRHVAIDANELVPLDAQDVPALSIAALAVQGGDVVALRGVRSAPWVVWWHAGAWHPVEPTASRRFPAEARQRIEAPAGTPYLLQGPKGDVALFIWSSTSAGMDVLPSPGWLLTLDAGRFVEARPVRPPAGARFYGVFATDAEPPFAVFDVFGTEGAFAGTLACDAAACQWAIDRSAAFPVRDVLTLKAVAGRDGDGTPVLAGACPQGGCTEPGVPVAMPGEVFYVPIPRGPPEHLRVRPRPGGGFVLASFDPADGHRVHLATVDPQGTATVRTVPLGERQAAGIELIVRSSSQPPQTVWVFYTEGTTLGVVEVPLGGGPLQRRTYALATP